MKNIYDIYREQKLYFVLADDICKNVVDKRFDVAIVMNLYYDDTAEFYLTQLAKYSKFFDVYVVTANENIKNKAVEKKLYVICKENRGRDISAFLVAASNVYADYSYVCFTHDKKEHAESPDEGINLWKDSLWCNVASSIEYICNVIDCFENHKDIGVLTVPEPIGYEWPIWGRKLWHGNMNNTMELCNSLNVEADFNEEKPPLSIGTSFWFKPDALSKLIKHNWKYTDFCEEPMPVDNTISHAIERCIPYVAQDAGYSTGVICSSEYAAKQAIFYSECFGEVMSTMLEKNMFYSYSTFKEYKEKIQSEVIMSYE